VVGLRDCSISELSSWAGVTSPDDPIEMGGLARGEMEAILKR